MASPRPDPLARVDRVLAPLTALAAVFAIVVLLAGPELIGAKAPSADAPAAGRQADLHRRGLRRLSHAGGRRRVGHVGPDLDQVAPDAATVASKVESGGGSMPSFDLPAPELDALAKYVADVAGR